MEIIGKINDITLIKGETTKIKVRTVKSEEDNTIIEKKEIIINDAGQIIIQ